MTDVLTTLFASDMIDTSSKMIRVIVNIKNLTMKLNIFCILITFLITLFLINEFKKGKEFNETGPETHQAPKLSMKRADLINGQEITETDDSDDDSIISSNFDVHQKLDTNKRIRISYISDPEKGKVSEVTCKPNRLIETDSTIKGISDDGKSFEILTRFIESKDLY